jgi:hypothetical protein
MKSRKTNEKTVVLIKTPQINQLQEKPYNASNENKYRTFSFFNLKSHKQT